MSINLYHKSISKYSEKRTFTIQEHDCDVIRNAYAAEDIKV
jgi:hypothetical protein